jgi:hypothetical protein
MENWSQVFQETIDEFESPYVPGDQGDAGKGQVLVRAGYTIHTTLDVNVGYIGKSPGQTQFYGVAVDALTHRVDGSGADFLTDEPQPDGTRLIKVAYTPYATPPPGTPPPTNWVQPTADYLTYPGPLVLKATTPPPQPEPAPEPPPSDTTARFDALDAAHAEIIATSNANTEAIQTQIHDLVEDAEATFILIAKVLLLFWRERPPRTKSGAQAVDELNAWLLTKARVIASDE